jgi:two-component system, OmpR family, response regulator
MRILLVENAKEVSKFLRNNLTAACFAVDAACDGEQGSYLVRTNDYDLVILNDSLPKKNGLEVCNEVRKSEISVPILVLAENTDAQNKVTFLNSGADDYITKPFSFEELLARVRALLRRPRRLANDMVHIDDLTVDIKGQAVFRGKREIYLTRKEFMVLEYLLRNQGLVLSRAMLLEHVWDMNVDPFSNTVESHIASLRKKIDLPGKRKLICTLNGRGYRFENS